MSDMIEPLIVRWRTEILAEIELAEIELAQANEARIAAELAARDAKIERGELAAHFERIDRRGPVANALRARFEHRAAALREIEGKAACARNRVEAAARRLEDHETAAGQLASMLPEPIGAREEELVET